MSSTMTNAPAPAPLQRLEGLRLRPAKVVIEVENARIRVGRALKRAIDICGTTDKEAADLLDLDKSQLSRWLSGGENIQVARIHGTRLHGPFAIEQARDAEGCVVETTVTYRRPA